MGENRNWMIWVEAVIFAFAAVILYNLPVLQIFSPILLVVPLHILYLRRGKGAFAFSLVVAFFITILLKMVPFWRDNGLAVIDGAVTPDFLHALNHIILGAMLMGGIWLINMLTRYRTVTRIMLATLGAGLLGVFVFFVTSQTGVLSVVAALIDEVIFQVAKVAQPEQGELFQSFWSSFSSGDKVWLVLSTGYSISYILNLAAGWWLGMVIGRRFFKISVPIYRAINFYADNRLIWGIILCIILFVAGLFMQSYFVVITVFCIFMVLLYVFGIQGLGIIQFLLDKFRISVMMRRMLPLLILGIIMVSQEMIMLLMIVIPGLGISEIWIKYRKSSNKGK